MTCNQNHNELGCKFCPECGMKIEPVDKDFVHIEPPTTKPVDQTVPDVPAVPEKSEEQKYADYMNNIIKKINEDETCLDNESILGYMIMMNGGGEIEIPDGYIIMKDGQFIPWEEHPLYKPFDGDTSQLFFIGHIDLNLIDDPYKDCDIDIDSLYKRYEAVKSFDENIILKNKETILKIKKEVADLMSENKKSTENDTPHNLKKILHALIDAA